jgi:hypothetical protein
MRFIVMLRRERITLKGTHSMPRFAACGVRGARSRPRFVSVSAMCRSLGWSRTRPAISTRSATWGGAAAPLTPGYGESRFQREEERPWRFARFGDEA